MVVKAELWSGGDWICGCGLQEWGPQHRGLGHLGLHLGAAIE